MKNVRQSWNWTIAMAAVSATLLGAGTPALAQQLRSLGIDVSDWQGNISAANWATLKRATNVQVSGVYGDGKDFVFIRSSRGGTTGVYNENDPNNTTYGTNTLSQRYDDYYFGQNITLATSAGLLAGPYHFVRPDIIASTLNSGGIANTGTDEANHLIQMAGAWMRPGYLLPVCDLEVGQSQHSIADLTAFCTNFSARIYAVMGLRPMMYINGSYANSVQSPIVSYFPNLWSARWPTTVNPQTNNPSDSYTPIYGPWDDPPYPPQPWEFWQYSDTNKIHAISGSIDVDVAQGGLEFVKDYLVPALWVTTSSGQWTTLSNWNSGQTPVAPPYYPGQPRPSGTTTLPTPGLPANNDTVILDVPGASVTVTLASGAQNIRKLYMRETLNITGGSLTINYIPSWDSTPIAAQFSGPVTLSGSASLSLHTLQVDATNTFTLNGGTLTFNTINLMPDSAKPAKIAMSGDVNFNPLTNATATITNGAGSGSSGLIDLGAAPRAFNVANGTGLFVCVPITNGALTKTGLGTMCLGVNNPYGGGTTVSSGTLALTNSGAINNSSQLSLASGATFDVSALASPYNLSSSTSLSASGTGTAVGNTAAAIKGASGGTVSLGSRPITLTYDGSHPALYISQGTLQLQGNVWTVNASSALAAGTYAIVQQASGSITSSGTPTVSGTAIGSGKTASIQVSSGNVNLVVQNTTTTALATVATPQTYGTVTFSATVSPSTAGGTVTFKDGATTLGTGNLSGGTAAFTPTASQLAVAGSPHSITAAYGGDSLDTASASSASTLNITAKALTVTGLSVPSSKVYDGTTATATPNGTATLQGAEAAGPGTGADGKPYTGDTVTISGSATSSYNTKDVATANLVTFNNLSTANGNYTITAPTQSATITTKPLTMSGLSVPASKVYDGTTAATVSGAPGTLTGSESPGSGNSSDGLWYAGDTVNLTGTATGAYNSKDVASATTVTYGGLSLGGTQATDYSLTIQSPAAATITMATTAGAFTSSPNPSLPGSDVTFTATVTNAVPGGPAPVGNVQFKTNGVALCDPVALDGSGVAAFITNSLPRGSNTVTAEFAGDSNFLGLTNCVVQIVNTPPIVAVPPTYSNGTFRVTFAGISNYAYTVQWAPLVTGDWSFLETATAGADGLFQVTDTPVPPASSRYYRIIYP